VTKTVTAFSITMGDAVVDWMEEARATARGMKAIMMSSLASIVNGS
jgi:hypothetical protein